jgi:hypothetical protein
MTSHGETVEGEPAPRFRVSINGVMQEGGFDTFKAARASVQRLDVNVEIFDRNKRVFGELQWYPPRPGEETGRSGRS